MPDFDAYLMVDWSAKNERAAGADSIWYSLVTRKSGDLVVESLENPATRSLAAAEIKGVLRDLVKRDQTVLVGFDFPYGYPTGFAKSLGLDDAPRWLAIWREIASRIVDRHDNRNNRFVVAADFNRRISGGPCPFWGCPTGCAGPTLSCTKHGTGGLPEKRITDVGAMQPIWKLFGAGAVGSQALCGIPYLLALRTDPVLEPVSRVWPFETGLGALPSRAHRDWLVLHAEIYPSLLPSTPLPNEVKDAVQVRTLARHFAQLDDGGRLAELFEGDSSLTAAEKERVEREESWTLGVGGKNQMQRRLDLTPPWSPS
jgi:precorrin-8X/cobalt-precorrin-8 methylmutase